MITLTDEQAESLLRKHREFEELLGRYIVAQRVQEIEQSLKEAINKEGVYEE